MASRRVKWVVIGLVGMLGLVLMMFVLFTRLSAPVGTVARVIDGDTIELDDGRRVRLLGVDAPEMKGRKDNIGELSRDCLREIAQARRVVVETEKRDKDRYGRTLAYLWLADVWPPTMVNLEMIRRGCARAMLKYKFGRQLEFQEAEWEARLRGVFLWGAGIWGQGVSP